MKNYKHLFAVLLIGVLAVLGLAAFEEAETSPVSEIILLPYGEEESYYLYVGESEYQHYYEQDAWEQRDNGLQTQGDDYDFIMREDYVVFYTNKPVERVYVLEGEGRIEYITDTQFIYHGGGELPDYLVLDIIY